MYEWHLWRFSAANQSPQAARKANLFGWSMGFGLMFLGYFVSCFPPIGTCYDRIDEHTVLVTLFLSSANDSIIHLSDSLWLYRLI